MFSLHIDYPDDRAALVKLSHRVGLTAYALGAACCLAGVACFGTVVTGRPLWAVLLFGALAALLGVGAHLAGRLDHLTLDQLDATRDQKETGQC
ncbi:MAG: hypothetical protein HOV83_07220 [Catenulispora sp.]|nr:hypothetical protein [Catenulispora sp.]